MPTYGELIDEIIAYLMGYVSTPQLGTLVGPIANNSTTFALDFGDNPGAARPNGLLEIDRELMVVNRYDPGTGVCVVAPWGRGANSTTAAAHSAGARVTVRPPFPRKRVGDVVNEVLRSCAPMVYAVKDLAPIETGTLIGLGYPLPADLIRVLYVDETDTSLPEFIATRRVYRNWTVRTIAGQKLLEVDRTQVLQTFQVTYAARPGTLVNESDDFATVTGFTEDCRDLVVFGSVARLVMASELSRQQISSAEAAIRADKIQAGSSTAVSKYFQALYAQRLQAEQDRLNQTYPLQLLRRG